MSTLKYPIVHVTIKNKYSLDGLYLPVKDARITFLHVHGTGGRFSYNRFHPFIAQSVNRLGLSYLTGDNHGSGIYELEREVPPSGVSLEIFEDCLQDIDAWIELALSSGHQSIILEGHSFGIGKVTYYMAKGKYRGLVKAVIFLGSNGVFQTQQHYLAKKGVPWNSYLVEASGLTSRGQETALLEDPMALAGYYPCSARTYLNFFKDKSKMYKSTQMAGRKDGGYRHLIKVPLLWILGDDPKKEYLFVPFSEAFSLVRLENPQVEIHQLVNCDHGLNGKEQEAALIISDFLRRSV